MAILKPKTPLTPEQQLQRRRNLGVGLAALSETLRGGDPVARTLGLMEQFEQEEAISKQEQLNKNLDITIDESDLPQSQKNLLKALSPNLKAQALIKSFEPKEKKYPTKYEEYLLTDPTPTSEEFKAYVQPTKLPTSSEQINALKLSAINTLVKYKGDEEKFKKAEPALHKIYEDLIKRSDDIGFLEQLLSGEGDLQYSVKRKD